MRAKGRRRRTQRVTSWIQAQNKARRGLKEEERKTGDEMEQNTNFLVGRQQTVWWFLKVPGGPSWHSLKMRFLEVLGSQMALMAGTAAAC